MLCSLSGRLLHAGRCTSSEPLRSSISGEPEDDSVASDLWHALRDHVTLIDLYDEDHLPQELCHRIDQARSGSGCGARGWDSDPRNCCLTCRTRSAAACMSTRRSCHLATSARSCARGTRNSLRRSPTCSSSTRSIRKSSLLTVGLTFIGSMNVLAHRQGGRHGSSLFQSPMLAERVLGQERVDELAEPPTCPVCGMAVRLASARGGNCAGAAGRSTATAPRGGCGWVRPFRDRPRTRNQPAPRTAVSRASQKR